MCNVYYRTKDPCIVQTLLLTDSACLLNLPGFWSLYTESIALVQKMFDVNELGSTDRRIFWIACWCFTAKGRTTVPLNKLLLWDQSLNVGDICNSLTSSPLIIFFYQQSKSQPVLQTQINFRKFISPVAPLPLFAAHRGSNSLLPCGKNLYRATEFSARGLARTLWFQSPIKVGRTCQSY